MKVSILQFDIDFVDPDKNRKKVSEMIDKASKGYPDVILLPEMWNTSFNFNSIREKSDKNGQPTLTLLTQKAIEYNVNIVAGSISDMINDKVYNRSYVIDRDGSVKHSYDKIHLVHHANEDTYIEAGSRIEVFEIDGIKCGIIICYDFRFPEICRTLALKGAEVVFAPVQWFESRLSHYEVFCKARALENQIFIVSANRIGQEFKAVFPGQSMVVDPWANIIGRMDHQEGILHCEIDLKLINRIRKKVTCFDDRRPDLYK